MALQRTKITIYSDNIISVPDAAKELGVNFSTVYRWIHKGTIHPIRIASQVYISRDDVKAIKKQRANE